MNLLRVELNSLFYKLLNKGIYITAPLQTFPFLRGFFSSFIFLKLKLGHSPFDPHELSYQRVKQKKAASFPCCCGSEKKTGGKKGGMRGEIKGEEDVVKTQAPKRLT